MPVAYPTEALGFYINIPTGFTIGQLGVANFGTLRLDMVNRLTGAVSSSIATLQRDFFADGVHFNIYATVVWPALQDGIYYLRIYNTTTSTTTFTSNDVQVKNDKSVLDRETVFVRFRHDRVFYDIRYQALTGFYQQFRLHINLLESQFETDKEVYRSVTTGKNRTFQNYISKFCKMEAYYFDEQAHDAMMVLTEHSFVEMNGKLYTNKALYKKLANNLQTLSKGEWEAYEEAFASVNRC